MAAQAGKDILIKMNTAAVPGTYTTVAGIRTPSLSLNGTTIDVTTADSTGRWRELLAASGVRTREVSGSGVFGVVGEIVHRLILKMAPRDSRPRICRQRDLALPIGFGAADHRSEIEAGLSGPHYLAGELGFVSASFVQVIGRVRRCGGGGDGESQRDDKSHRGASQNEPGPGT